MDSAELFTRAVTSLPAAARKRLDGAAPLDWPALEDPATGIRLAEAARSHRRLPEPIETLVERLIGDVGVVPADVHAGIEREGAATAWLRRAAIELDGESYRIRNDLNGEIHPGIRPEAIAGYATLALDLAAAVHEAAELWSEVGDRYGSAGGDGSGPLARCAIRMSERIRPSSGSDSRPRSTGSLAEALEDGWNSQSLADRAELSATIRLNTARGAAAPRQCHFVPMNGYRMHACDPAEIRWLRALAERALRGVPAPNGENAAAPTGWDADIGDETLAMEIGGLAAAAGGETVSRFETPPDPGSDDFALDRELADLRRIANGLPASAGSASSASEDAASLDMTALEAQIRAETSRTLELGSYPDEPAPDEVLARIERAAKRLPGPVGRRMGAAYGVGVALALTRLDDPRERDAVESELRALANGGPVPRWLKDLAGAVLADAGACTQGGLRTGSLRLDPEDGVDGGYLVTELETGTQGRLTPRGLLEQIHLGLAFAHSAWSGLATLRTAGREGGWTLDESAGGNGRLAGNERETLEAAMQVERALDRAGNAYSAVQREPNALEQASMAADALTTVGPTVRVAAGWPGAAGPPDPRNPDDVARVAEIARALQGDIKTISNRLIAGQMAAPATRAEAREA